MGSIRKTWLFILVFFWALSLSIILTILFSPLLYQLIINFFNLTDISGLTSEELMVNYQYLVEYLIRFDVSEFNMPYFSSSSGGVIHFQEVRQLSILNLLLFLVLSGLVIRELWVIKKRRWKYQVNHLYYYLQIFPLFLLLMIIISFDQVFLLFHRLLFNNDLWIFNPLYDPVINVLPQGFFMVLFVLAILIYEIIIIALKVITKSIY